MASVVQRGTASAKETKEKNIEKGSISFRMFIQYQERGCVDTF